MDDVVQTVNVLIVLFDFILWLIVLLDCKISSDCYSHYNKNDIEMFHKSVFVLLLLSTVCLYTDTEHGRQSCLTNSNRTFLVKDVGHVLYV